VPEGTSLRHALDTDTDSALAALVAAVLRVGRTAEAEADDAPLLSQAAVEAGIAAAATAADPTAAYRRLLPSYPETQGSDQIIGLFAEAAAEAGQWSPEAAAIAVSAAVTAVAAPAASGGVSRGQRVLVLLELFAQHMRNGDSAVVPLGQWRQALLLAHAKRGKAGVLAEHRDTANYYDHVAAVLSHYIALAAGPDSAREVAALAAQLVDFHPGYLSDALLQVDSDADDHETAGALWTVFNTALLAVHRLLQREGRPVDTSTWLKVALAVRTAVRHGRAAGKSDGAVARVQSVLTALRLRGTGVYRREAMRDAVTALLPPGSPYLAAVETLCKGSANAFLKAVLAAPDSLTDELYDALVSEQVAAAEGGEAGDGASDGPDAGALFFVDAAGDTAGPAADTESDDAGEDGDGTDEDDEEDDEDDDGEADDDIDDEGEADGLGLLADDISARALGGVAEPASPAEPTPKRSIRKRVAAKTGTPTSTGRAEPKRMRTRSARATRAAKR